MPGPYIRPVDRGDITAVAALERRCFDEPWPPVAFAQFVEADGFLVAVDPDRRPDGSGPPDGTLAGYVVTTPSSEAPTTVAHVRDLAVDPEYRRSGLAGRLLEHSLSGYTKRGLSRVRLEVRASNEPAIALYRKRGYRPARQIPRYYADGEAAIVMERPLDTADG
ncbi:MAG: GNAT family N-acetyltransferase [Halobacteriota archaeon]